MASLHACQHSAIVDVAKDSETTVGGETMAKLLAFLFFVAGAVRVWFDWQATIAQADPFRFSETGAVWAEIHFGSLQVFQPAVERYIGPWMWESMIFPVLLTPLAPILFGLSLIFWLFGRRKKS